MTNIYVTSYGLDTRYPEYIAGYDEIVELLQDRYIAVIPNAKLPNENRTNSRIALKELIKNNIDAEIVDLEKVDNIDKFNSFYISGGEPKYLMDVIHKYNFFKPIDRKIRSGDIVIGQSAGAMIMNREYFDTRTDKVEIHSNGFNFFDKIIVPHYDNLSGDIKNQLPSGTFNIEDTDGLIKL